MNEISQKVNFKLFRELCFRNYSLLWPVGFHFCYWLLKFNLFQRCKSKIHFVFYTVVGTLEYSLSCSECLLCANTWHSAIPRPCSIYQQCVLLGECSVKPRHSNPTADWQERRILAELELPFTYSSHFSILISRVGANICLFFTFFNSDLAELELTFTYSSLFFNLNSLLITVITPLLHTIDSPSSSICVLNLWCSVPVNITLRQILSTYVNFLIFN